MNTTVSQTDEVAVAFPLLSLILANIYLIPANIFPHNVPF